MMKFNTLKDVVQFRVVENEDNYWIEDYWKAAIEMFTKDIVVTINFVKNDCDNEELYWLSEIFEEIVEQTQSKEFISVLRTRLAEVTPENYNQQNFKSEHARKWVDFSEYVESIEKEISCAENLINE